MDGSNSENYFASLLLQDDIELGSPSAAPPVLARRPPSETGHDFTSREAAVVALAALLVLAAASAWIASRPQNAVAAPAGMSVVHTNGGLEYYYPPGGPESTARLWGANVIPAARSTDAEGEIAAMILADGFVYTYDLSTDERKNRWRNQEPGDEAVDVAVSRGYAVWVTGNGAAHGVNLRTNAPLQLGASASAARTIDVRAETVVIGMADGTVTRVEVPTGRVTSTAVSSATDGPLVAALAEGWLAASGNVVELHREGQRAAINLPDDARVVKLTSSDTEAAVLTQDGSIFRLELTDGLAADRVWSASSQLPAVDVDASPHGVAFVLEYGRVHLATDAGVSRIAGPTRLHRATRVALHD